MTRVLLTGATGFVGRETIRPLLDAGCDVHAIGRTPCPDLGVTSHRCDLLTDDVSPIVRLVRPSHLLHLAWHTEPGKFWQAKENLSWVAASLRLLEAFAGAGGRRVVLAGSCAEYDWSQSELDEFQSPLAPGSLYGESKAALYRLVMKAAPALEVSAGWGRIFFPYGPYEHPERLFGTFLDAIAQGKPATFSAGTQERNFIHVSDVGAAFVRFLTGPVEGPVNIACAAPVSVREFIETAARIAGAQHLVRFGERPLQDGEPPRLAAVTKRLVDSVGYNAKFSLEAGLRDAIDCHMTNLRKVKG